jgi:hypothetical protein
MPPALHRPLSASIAQPQRALGWWADRDTTRAMGAIGTADATLRASGRVTASLVDLFCAKISGMHSACDRHLSILCDMKARGLAPVRTLNLQE